MMSNPNEEQPPLDQPGATPDDPLGDNQPGEDDGDVEIVPGIVP